MLLASCQIYNSFFVLPGGTESYNSLDVIGMFAKYDSLRVDSVQQQPATLSVHAQRGSHALTPGLMAATMLSSGLVAPSLHVLALPAFVSVRIFACAGLARQSNACRRCTRCGCTELAYGLLSISTSTAETVCLLPAAAQAANCMLRL